MQRGILLVIRLVSCKHICFELRAGICRWSPKNFNVTLLGYYEV